MRGQIFSKEQLMYKGSIFDAAVPFTVNENYKVFSCYTNENICSNNVIKCWVKDKKVKITKRRITCKECQSKPNYGCRGIVHDIHFGELEKVIRKDSDESYEINYVNRFKVRPYLLLSINAECLTNRFKEYVWGAPITSIKPKMLSNENMMKLLRDNKVPGVYYIDENTRGIKKPSLIDLVDIKLIHKSSIVDYRGYLELKDLYYIQKQIENMLDLNYLNSVEDLEMLEIQKKDIEYELEAINKKIDSLNKSKQLAK